MKYYVPIKQMNPDLPFLVREAPNVDSTLHVHYAYGVTRAIPLDGLSEEGISDRVRLAYDIGRTLPQFPVDADESEHEAIVDGSRHWSHAYKDLPVKEIHPDQ